MMQKKEFECKKTFLCRIAGQPLEVEEWIDGSSIKELEDLFEERMKEVIYTSSRSLYCSLRKGISQENIEAFLKYLIRNWCRATPFGQLAGVCLGRNGTDSFSIDVDRRCSRYRVDTEWICGMENLIEKIYIEQLEVFTNNTIKVNSYGVLNEWISGYYSQNNLLKSQIIIKNNALITDIFNKAKFGIKVTKLIDEISVRWKVNQDEVLKVIVFLLKEEFLLSLYKRNLLESDRFTNLYKLFQDNIENSMYQQLLNIEYGLIELNQENNTNNLTEIVKIEKKLEALFENQNYLNIDTFYDMTVGLDIEEDLIEFCSFLKLFAKSYTVSSKLLSFFMENYGDRFIKVVDFLDDLVELDLRIAFDSTSDNMNVEKLWSYCTDNSEDKIIELDKITFEDYEFCSYADFELCLQVLENKDKKYYLLPEFWGCEMKNQAIGKYSYIYEELLNDKNDLNEDYMWVELAFYPKKARAANIMLSKTTCQGILNYGVLNSAEEKNIVEIEDVYVGIVNGKFAFWSNQYKKELKFTISNLIDVKFMPPIIAFLYEATKKQFCSIFNLHYIIAKLKKVQKHTPRIVYKRFIICPETWVIRYNDIVHFECELVKYIKKLGIKNKVMMCSEEGCLCINLSNEFQIQIMEKELKKKKVLFLQEYLYQEFVPLLKDNKGSKYVSECVFEIKSGSDNTSELNADHSLAIQREYFLPGEEWLYYKLYTKKIYQNVILTECLEPKLRKLKDDGLVKNYFFIRYIDEEKHSIRLRIQLQNNVSDILNLVNQLLRNLVDERIVSRIVVDTYDREIYRYGGSSTYGLVEELFCEDTYKVIQCLSEKTSYSEMEKAILSLIEFMRDLGLTIEEQVELMGCYSACKKNEKEFRKIKTDLFEEIMKMQFSSVVNTKRGKTAEKLNKNIFFASKMMKDEMYKDFLHMHLNRLVGVDRKMEEKVYINTYYLLKSIKGYKKHNCDV